MGVKEFDRGIWQGRQIADSMMCYSKGFLLRFLSLVPSQYSSGKKPRKNQRRTKVKECDGTHSEYCARKVPTLRIKRNT